jgi:hypothetical protein
MNIDTRNGIIRCHVCEKYLQADPKYNDVYIDDKQVRCIYDDTLLGYVWDAPSIFTPKKYSYGRADES